MKSLKFLFALLLVSIAFTTPSVAQDSVGACTFIDGQATVTVTVSAKDTEWSAISLVTSKGVVSKKNSRITIGEIVYLVNYNEDSKQYTASLEGGRELLSSTTVAAIRSHIASDAYEKTTGRKAPNS